DFPPAAVAPGSMLWRGVETFLARPRARRAPTACRGRDRYPQADRSQEHPCRTRWPHRSHARPPRRERSFETSPRPPSPAAESGEVFPELRRRDSTGGGERVGPGVVGKVAGLEPHHVAARHAIVLALHVDGATEALAGGGIDTIGQGDRTRCTVLQDDHH